MDELRKWNNIKSKEGRKNYKKLRKEFKNSTEKAKK
jgi:hypothetical protein